MGDVLYKQDKYGRKVGLTAVDEEVVIEWAKQIAEALNYLHTRTPHPIIYRDLNNIYKYIQILQLYIKSN